MNFGARWMARRFPRREAGERLLDAFIAWSAHVSRAQIWAITALAVALTELADFATGPYLWFGPLYLLIICLPAWALGWRAGFAVGLICAGASLAVNGMSAYPLGHLAVAWNMAMRILSVAIIVVLVGGFRRSYDREWRRARKDGLTGALNKQAFYEETAVVRARGKWGVLAYIDLDDFKQVNDRHGHAAGDETLCAFATGVRGSIRAKDLLARIGGDEFLLFLAVENEAEGYRMATQLHARMNSILNGMTYPIRCSMGALVLEPDPRNVTEADIELADRLMYQAKRTGVALRIATRNALPKGEAHPAFARVSDAPELDDILPPVPQYAAQSVFFAQRAS